jgi:hypothetical protein
MSLYFNSKHSCVRGSINIITDCFTRTMVLLVCQTRALYLYMHISDHIKTLIHGVWQFTHKHIKTSLRIHWKKLDIFKIKCISNFKHPIISVLYRDVIQPCRQRKYVPPNRYPPMSPHGVTVQKTNDDTKYLNAISATCAGWHDTSNIHNFDPV